MIMAGRKLKIETSDGPCAATLFAPPRPAGNGAAVIVYLDAFGPRPAMDLIAGRLAGLGYAALVPDLFYRFGAYGRIPGHRFEQNCQRG